MLSRIAYRKALKVLDHYRKQHEDDRRENPGSIPASWGGCLVRGIENAVRENGERYHKGQAEDLLEEWVKKGLLVRYAGDYTFPTGERLPSANEIMSRVGKMLGVKNANN